MNGKAKYNNVIFPLRRIKTELSEFIEDARNIYYKNGADLEEAQSLIMDVINRCAKERDENES